MVHNNRVQRLFRVASAVLAFCVAFSQPAIVLAETKEDRIAAHQAMTIQSNEIAGWPTGPIVSAESAILIEAQTGTILYSKNIHKQQFPASTTKILTALLAYENSSLDEIVTFSREDVFGIPRGSNNIAMDVGYTLSMEDCLRALLIRSANEVAYAMASHVGGSWDEFANMMNKRAKELGAVDSNFVNPNGLPNEEHVTSAYDLAMIGRAFFQNDYLCKITLSPKLVVTKPNGELTEWNQMALIPTGKYAYEYLVGCKTGYTDSAHSTLVSCAEKNGMRLICVVLNDENPFHNEDTIALFEYGFNNFKKVNVSQAETKYDIDKIGLFYSAEGIFGHSEPLLSLSQSDCIIQPNSVDFQDLTSSISYESTAPGQAALITYSYHGVDLGTVSLDLKTRESAGYAFESEETTPPAETSVTASPADQESTEKDNIEKTSKNNDKGKNTEEKAPKNISINPKILWGVLIALGGVALIALIFWFLKKNYSFSFSFSLKDLFRSRSRRSPKRPRRRKRGNDLTISDEMKKRRAAEIRDAKRRYRERMKHK